MSAQNERSDIHATPLGSSFYAINTNLARLWQWRQDTPNGGHSMHHVHVTRLELLEAIVLVLLLSGIAIAYTLNAGPQEKHIRGCNVSISTNVTF